MDKKQKIKSILQRINDLKRRIDDSSFLLKEYSSCDKFVGQTELKLRIEILKMEIDLLMLSK